MILEESLELNQEDIERIKRYSDEFYSGSYLDIRLNLLKFGDFEIKGRLYQARSFALNMTHARTLCRTVGISYEDALDHYDGICYGALRLRLEKENQTVPNEATQ